MADSKITIDTSSIKDTNINIFDEKYFDEKKLNDLQKKVGNKSTVQKLQDGATLKEIGDAVNLAAQGNKNLRINISDGIDDNEIKLICDVFGMDEDTVKTKLNNAVENSKKNISKSPRYGDKTEIKDKDGNIYTGKSVSVESWGKGKTRQSDTDKNGELYNNCPERIIENAYGDFLKEYNIKPYSEPWYSLFEQIQTVNPQIYEDNRKGLDNRAINTYIYDEETFYLPDVDYNEETKTFSLKNSDTTPTVTTTTNEHGETITVTKNPDGTATRVVTKADGTEWGRTIVNADGTAISMSKVQSSTDGDQIHVTEYAKGYDIDNPNSDKNKILFSYVYNQLYKEGQTKEDLDEKNLVNKKEFSEDGKTVKKETKYNSDGSYEVIEYEEDGKTVKSTTTYNPDDTPKEEKAIDYESIKPEEGKSTNEQYQDLYINWYNDLDESYKDYDIYQDYQEEYEAIFYNSNMLNEDKLQAYKDLFDKINITQKDLKKIEDDLADEDFKAWCQHYNYNPSDEYLTTFAKDYSENFFNEKCPYSQAKEMCKTFNDTIDSFEETATKFDNFNFTNTVENGDEFNEIKNQIIDIRERLSDPTDGLYGTMQWHSQEYIKELNELIERINALTIEANEKKS